MKLGIISRGSDRSGIDRDAGRERLAVEIDWAGSDDMELRKAFAQWLKKARPDSPKIGRAENSKPDYEARLKALATARILKYYGGLGSIPPDGAVWDWVKKWWKWKEDYKTPKELSNNNTGDEMYKVRRHARFYLQELFPFLPENEISSAFKKRGARAPACTPLRQVPQLA